MPRARAGRDNPRDEDRFYCPFPGCNRSCAELWRLKVHYRASPNNKGSGIERGHGQELPECPRCHAKLEDGKHHMGCRKGLAAPRQAAKRDKDLRPAGGVRKAKAGSRSRSHSGSGSDRSSAGGLPEVAVQTRARQQARARNPAITPEIDRLLNFELPDEEDAPVPAKRGPAKPAPAMPPPQPAALQSSQSGFAGLGDAAQLPGGVVGSSLYQPSRPREPWDCFADGDCIFPADFALQFTPPPPGPSPQPAPMMPAPHPHWQPRPMQPPPRAQAAHPSLTDQVAREMEHLLGPPQPRPYPTYMC